MTGLRRRRRFDGQELAHEVLEPLGVRVRRRARAQVEGGATRCSTIVGSNVAMLRPDRGTSRDEAREYSATWSLQPADRIDKQVDSIEARRRRYKHSYPQGLRLGRGACRRRSGALPGSSCRARLQPRELER